MSKPQSPSLTIKRKLKAPAEKVFVAWTQPEALKPGSAERRLHVLVRRRMCASAAATHLMHKPRRRRSTASGRLQGDRRQPQAGLHLGWESMPSGKIARHRRHQAQTGAAS